MGTISMLRISACVALAAVLLLHASVDGASTQLGDSIELGDELPTAHLRAQNEQLKQGIAALESGGTLTPAQLAQSRTVGPPIPLLAARPAARPAQPVVIKGGCAGKVKDALRKLTPIMDKQRSAIKDLKADVKSCKARLAKLKIQKKKGLVPARLVQAGIHAMKAKMKAKNSKLASGLDKALHRMNAADNDTIETLKSKLKQVISLHRSSVQSFQTEIQAAASAASATIHELHEQIRSKGCTRRGATKRGRAKAAAAVKKAVKKEKKATKQAVKKAKKEKKAAKVTRSAVKAATDVAARAARQAGRMARKLKRDAESDLDKAKLKKAKPASSRSISKAKAEKVEAASLVKRAKTAAVFSLKTVKASSAAAQTAKMVARVFY